MAQKIIPSIRQVPEELKEVSLTIAQWAKSKRLIERVYVFGSAFRGKTNAKDLDIAVEYVLSDEAEALGAFMLDRDEWTGELASLTGRKIDLDLAHPKAAPTVWRYLSEGCGLAYFKQ
jgi:predicted nucleotidyltransferase